MGPYLTASLAVLEELYDALVALLRPLDEDCLNWSPLPQDTNSITNLTCHIAGSVNSGLARALDEPFERDRDAEFRTHYGSGELLAVIERSREQARGQFERLEGIDLGAIRQVRRLAAGGEGALTAAWCVQHALIHAGEHWGQIQLNAQLYGRSHRRQ